MIQRIQSVYLLIVAVLLTVMLLQPIFTIDFASPEQKSEVIKMTPFGIKSISSESADMVPSGIESVSTEVDLSRTSYVGALVILCLLLTAVIIFLYRFRWIQMRLCVMLMVVLAGLQIFIGYYMYEAREFAAMVKELPSGQSVLPVSYSVTNVFPVVCVILVYLAFRGILKDEVLVKSLNRIR